MRRWIPVIGILIATALIAYVLIQSQNDKTVAGEAIVTIQNSRITVDVVREPEAQAKGLSELYGLSDDRGMLFVFDPADDKLTFWMDGMMFDLDIVWIANGRIAQIDRQVPHPLSGQEPEKRTGPRLPVSAVLEVRASIADQWNVGDVVEIAY